MSWTETLAAMCAPVGLTAGAAPFVLAGARASAWAVSDWGVLGAFEVTDLSRWTDVQDAFIDHVEAHEAQLRLELGTLDAWLLLLVREAPDVALTRRIQLDTELCRKHVLLLGDDPAEALSAVTCLALPAPAESLADASGAGDPFYARAAAAKDLRVLRERLADVEAGT
jgi:hypothetical protein